MSRKLLAGLTPLLVISALVLPAAAQALPHWYKKNVQLTAAHTTVATGGSLTFTSVLATVKCKVSDAEEIWNPVGGGPGEDLVTGFTTSGCKIKVGSSACPKVGSTPTIVANGLNWPSFLVNTPPIRDEIVKIRLKFGCSAGAVPDEFEGTLTPAVGNGKLVFGGPGGGALHDALLNTMEVSGNDTMVALPGKVTAKDP
jgi:hypothetical protein